MRAANRKARRRKVPQRIYRRFEISNLKFQSGGIFSVALSVGAPFGSPPASISQPRLSATCKLRGIAPCGVRTFLPHPGSRDGSDSPPFQNRTYDTRFWKEIKLMDASLAYSSRNPNALDGT